MKCGSGDASNEGGEGGLFRAERRRERRIETKKTKKQCVQLRCRNFQDSRGGTNTAGPGEAVFASRFQGKAGFEKKNVKKNIPYEI